MKEKKTIRRKTPVPGGNTGATSEFFVVGIGASAGGVQALQHFFRNVPAGSGCAYVVILHLSPNHDSQLANVLQQETEMMVVKVTQRTLIEANVVYVVPPDHHLTVDQGHIAALPNMQIEDRRAPVDIFFRSLANQYGSWAISVVLSGTGANGSMGLKRIKELGGATFVQNPREAEFNEMPRNAIATELIDEVLNVADIPGKLVSYIRGIKEVHLQEEPEGSSPEGQQRALETIFTQLKLRTGHDFSNYKRPTLLRRIERRINVHGLSDLKSYVAELINKPEETHALLKDLLISVTNFFRDKEAFTYLETNIIPALFEGKNSADQVRIWVAGCATGEEAYSLAMFCAEFASQKFDSPRVQIFATDIDGAAIATAREGLYTINDAADVSANRLSQFFTREGDLHRVRKEIREMILFADHNFLKDPPFSRLDLVSCRNVMIYLNQTAQARVVESFHFALKRKGFLFLGSSESVDAGSDLFSVYNRDHHIYTTREISLRNYPVPETIPRLQYTTTFPSREKAQSSLQGKRLSFGDLHQKMLEEYAPPSVVINQGYDIVHMSENAGKYFEFSGGEPTQNLLKLVSPAIRLELRAALFQALQLKGPVEIHDIKTVVNGHAEILDIHIRPALKKADYAEGFILIIFKPAQEHVREKASIHVVESHEPVAKHLEKELVGLKSQLRDSIEYHEYQAEELKASNEELQAMNEELRSAAEELETSKEELQSINEELRTVNQELKVKVEETTVSSNNLQNLINSSSVGTIFVDRNFTIRLYTPAVLDIFNLKPGDYGRPVTDITHNLKFDGLLALAESVLTKLTVIEEEVGTTDNRLFMMRLLPYRTDEDRIGGVVITFYDITNRKASELALKRSEEQMRLLIAGVKDYAIFMINPQRRIMVWNVGAQLIFGYTDSDVIGKISDIIFTEEDRKRLAPEHDIQECEKLERSENDRWHLRKDGSRFWGSGITQPIRKEDGEITGYVIIMRDLTQQRSLQQALQESEQKYRTQLEKSVAERTIALDKIKEQYLTLVENTPDVITRWDSGLKLLFANTAFTASTTGVNQTIIGLNIAQIDRVNELVIPYTQILQNTFETAETIEHFKSIHFPGETRHFHFRLTPEINAEDRVDTVLAIARDITAMKEAEIALNDSRDLLQSILDNSSIAMSVLAAQLDESGNLTDFQITLTNKELEKETGRSDLIGKFYIQEYPGIRSSGLFDLMTRVFTTGKAEGLEYFYPYDGFNKWYSCMFVKMGDSLLATNVDVTERKLAEEKVTKSEERLRMFVTASSDLIFHMDAGWTQMLVLKSDVILAGTQAPIDKWMIHYIPKSGRHNFRKAVRRAVADKVMFELEHHIYLADGSVGWANSRAIPLLNEDGDIIEWFGVATDITDRKLFEQERDRNYLLLQQAEKVASTGTWDYNLSTGEMTWSEGMYSLYNFSKDAHADLNIYEQHALSDNLDIAIRITKSIKNAVDGYEEILKVYVNESVKVLKLTARVIRNAKGTPIRVLGVDMDVTLSSQVEEKIKHMESQSQLEIFKAILNTQEEERRRISESLHNGLGQLLYGIKLSMDNLRLKLATSKPEQYEAAIKYTGDLLTEAIKESRSISHKLMPAALEQFGLRSAIDEVCKQLNGKVKFRCRYIGIDQRLENYLELAIFRIVQELMLNVVKHSGAAKADISVTVDIKQIQITVHDSGHGMVNSNGSQTGIGLKSIRSKIKLLNGNMSIKSDLGKGTEIKIYIPLQHPN